MPFRAAARKRRCLNIAFKVKKIMCQLPIKVSARFRPPTFQVQNHDIQSPLHQSSDCCISVYHAPYISL